MRIEKLADNKIKVTLTSADLTHMDIKIEQLTPNSKELHTFLFNVMETIREETGFNPYNGQVVVEATPIKDGLSIMVSKIAEAKQPITREQFKRIKSIKPKKKQNTVKFSLYYFDDFDVLCDALVNIEEKALKNSELYKRSDRYCLMVKKDAAFAKSHYILSEFSVKNSGHIVLPNHIMEHWTFVASRESLLNMVRGIIGLEEKFGKKS